MKVELEKISTVAGCDIQLAKAQKQKQTLYRKRRNLGESIETFAKRMEQIGKESAEVQVMLEAFTTAYNALPEGKYKINMNVKVKRLELRKARLNMKAFTYNVRSLLSKQIRYNKLDSQVSAIDSYITAVQNKKTALHNTALHVTAAADFSSLPVVHQKSRTAKRVYNAQARSSNPTTALAKRNTEKSMRSLTPYSPSTTIYLKSGQPERGPSTTTGRLLRNAKGPFFHRHTGFHSQ